MIGKFYYLDSNAWIALGSCPGLHQELVSSHRRGEIQVRVRQQNVDELLNVHTVSEENRQINMALLLPFIDSLQEDRLIILEKSLIDSATFSTESDAKVFNRHLRNKEPTNSNIRDGIHLVNALEKDVSLVSCDGQLGKTACDMAITLVCFSVFSAIVSQERRVECLSQKCRR